MGALKSNKCTKGHLLKGENVYAYVTADGTAKRECKKCARERNRKWKQARKVA